MNYKYLITLFFTVAMINYGFSQTLSQKADLESKKLRIYFMLSSQQEDSLKAALPAYYAAKTSFQQQSNRTSTDTKNLQKLHDDILKKIFTTTQYLQYEAVKQQQIQFMQQRMDSLSTH